MGQNIGNMGNMGNMGQVGALLNVKFRSILLAI